MKFLKVLILFIFIISGCSFKKNTSSPAQLEQESNKAAILATFEAIYSGTPEEVKTSLSLFTKKQLAELNVDGVSVIDAALDRGNPHILEIILDNGISPFTTNTKDRTKPYLKIHKLNSDIGNTIGKWILNKWLGIFQKTDLKEIATDLENFEITCVDMLNLYSWYSQSSRENLKYTHSVVEIAKSKKCLQNLSIAQTSLILRNELIGITRNSERNTDFLTFLVESPHFRNVLLSFKVDSGFATMKPYSFIRIISSLDSSKEILMGERLNDLLSFFREDKSSSINVYAGANKSLIETIYSSSEQKEKEIVKSALNLVNLGQSEGCFSYCDIWTTPDIQEGL